MTASTTTSTTERYLWPVAFALLIVLAIPWFLWGVDAVVAGLPVWIWWHVGWMVLAAATFHLFARRAWGLGIAEPASGAGASDAPESGGESA